jgi:hypothetical protein
MAFAVAGETKALRDLVMNHYQIVGREPFGYAIAPIRPLGAVAARSHAMACGLLLFAGVACSRVACSRRDLRF